MMFQTCDVIELSRILFGRCVPCDVRPVSRNRHETNLKRTKLFSRIGANGAKPLLVVSPIARDQYANADVIYLYSRVSVDAKVIVLPMERRADLGKAIR